MEQLYLKDIIKATEGNCSLWDRSLPIKGISTDSRKVQKGDLFIALIGENFDGHDFIEETLSSGAVAVVVSKPVQVKKKVPIIYVEDTLKALWKIASYYRQKLAKPVVAVTGSVGKTSTKDMIATVLSAKYNIHKSMGNFNNHIGMPLTVLGLENNHDAMIVEMGMRGLGEISTLTNIARPNIAVITNIGISHIERLGSRENILKAKLEIAEGLSDDGLLILNANDPLLKKVDKSIAPRVLYIGVETKADYQAYEVKDFGEKGVQFKIRLSEKEYKVSIPAVGVHNVHNVLYGIACGIELGMAPEEILLSIQNYQSEKMRLTIEDRDGIRFINDCYNSSPDSMKAGLQVLNSLSDNGRAFAIIGNMFELGDMAKKAHEDVGKMCNQYDVHFSAIIGENAKDVASGIGNTEKYKIFENHESIVKEMKSRLMKNDVVLIKGSRGMKMEKILELW